MPLTEPSFPDHLLQIFHNRFYRPSRLLCKLPDLAVFPVSEHLDVFPEPSYRARHARSGDPHDEEHEPEQPEDRHSDFQRSAKTGRRCAQSQKQQKDDSPSSENVSCHRQKYPAYPCRRPFEIEQSLRRRCSLLRLTSGGLTRCRILPFPCSGVIPEYTVHIDAGSSLRVLPVVPAIPAAVFHAPGYRIHCFADRI